MGDLSDSKTNFFSKGGN